MKETDVAREVSIDELMKHTAYLAEEDRESGSPGEARTMEYFRDFMEDSILIRPWPFHHCPACSR
jgi:hypothetical protein